jgi:hypothetical protein
MTESFDTFDGSTHEVFAEVLQVYIGSGLILLGVLLTGIVVRCVMSL